MAAADLLLVGVLAQNALPREIGLSRNRLRTLQAHAKSLNAALSWVQWAELETNGRRPLARSILKWGALLTNLASGKFEMAKADVSSRRPLVADQVTTAIEDMGKAAKSLRAFMPPIRKGIPDNTPTTLTIRTFALLEKKLRDQGFSDQAAKVAELLREYSEAKGVPSPPISTRDRN